MEEEKRQGGVVNHFEKDSNCQVFNGDVTGCVFAMPGSTVIQQPSQPTAGGGAQEPDKDAGQQAEEQDGGTVLPAVLAGSELWERVKDAGLVDEHGQPTVSRPEAALLADMLAQRLDIANKWKVFERMWNRKNMRNDYNTALDQKKSLAFQEKLKKILG